MIELCSSISFEFIALHASEIVATKFPFAIIFPKASFFQLNFFSPNELDTCRQLDLNVLNLNDLAGSTLKSLKC